MNRKRKVLLMVLLACNGSGMLQSGICCAAAAAAAYTGCIHNMLCMHSVLCGVLCTKRCAGPANLHNMHFIHHILCRVLCMEWIDGVKLTDKPKMDAAGLDIIDFVDIGIECTLRQLLEHGYFHADPHPGKLLPESCRVFLCGNSLWHDTWLLALHMHQLCRIHQEAGNQQQVLGSSPLYAHSQTWFCALARVCLNHV